MARTQGLTLYLPSNYVRHFFIANRHAGSYPACFVQSEALGGIRNPRSFLCYCRQCGEVYFRSPVLGQVPGNEWSGFAGCCHRCTPEPWWRHPAGDFLFIANTYPEIEEELSDEAYQYLARIYLEHDHE